MAVTDKNEYLNNSGLEKSFQQTKEYIDRSVNSKSTVSVSASGTSTDEVQYIVIDGVEKKLAGGGNNYVLKTGDTMTGRLKYTESTEPVTSLVAGKWYHLHVPAGTTSITSADGKIYISGKIKNIVTTLTATATVYENVIGWTSSAYPTGFVCFSGEVGSSYVGYNLSNASADFDCDFCYSSSTGTITNLLPFITNFVSNYALVSEIPTLKLNGTATTGSFYAPTYAGISGYILKSNGSGAPSWTTNNTITTTGYSTISLKFWKGTQAQYDSITTKDSNTFYIIVG